MSFSADNMYKVKNLIEARRVKALEEADRRLDALHEKSPEAAEIDRALRRTAMTLFRVACMPSGDEKEKQFATLRRDNLAMQSARAELLRSLGLPEDYTEVHYTCPMCRDTGYVDTRMCECMRRELVLAGMRSSGIGRLADRQSFDNFDLSYYTGGDREIMEYNLRVCRDFASGFPRGGENLLMMGHTGLGKTHLSTAVARAVIDRGYDVVYESAQNILSDYEHDRFHSGRADSEPRGEKYLQCDLLICDDLGTEFQNSFSVSVFYNLINTRINRALPTVISTNLTAQELRAHYDDRITSRLLGEFRLLRFCGQDVRLGKLGR